MTIFKIIKQNERINNNLQKTHKKIIWLHIK